MSAANHLQTSAPETDVLRQYFQLWYDRLWAKREQILKILEEISSHHAARDELDSALEAICGAAEELHCHRPQRVKEIAVFHSSNVILYSYVLYGIIPSAIADRILIRPSFATRDQLNRIHELLSEGGSPIIQLINSSQREFCELARNATVSVFTGRYENFNFVRYRLDNPLMLFFGTGSNPAIITAHADVPAATQSVVASRVVNSGQDCLCPDIVFVERGIADEFLQQLEKQVDQLVLGCRLDPKADINPLFYEGVAQSIDEYLQRNSQYVQRAGRVCVQSNTVEPVILYSQMSDMAEVYEFFAPVFNVVVYDCDDDVVEFLKQEDRHAMGLAIYGKREPFCTGLASLYSCVIDQSLFDAEDGNQPFGGYGPRASSVIVNGNTIGQPLLMSREISRYLDDNGEA